MVASKQSKFADLLTKYMVIFRYLVPDDFNLVLCYFKLLDLLTKYLGILKKLVPGDSKLVLGDFTLDPSKWSEYSKWSEFANSFTKY